VESLFTSSCPKSVGCRSTRTIFCQDNIVAELKCLTKNPIEAADWPPRLARAFRAAGHDFGDLTAYLFRGEKMPDVVKAKLVHWLRDSIRSVVKGANRQIRASKTQTGGALGLLLIANDHNYGFGPEGMLAVIGDAAARLPDNHIDAFVYFTPNVFHRKTGSDVAWVLWRPQYKTKSASSLMSEFINDMGRTWNDYTVTITGDPFVEREEREQTDNSLFQPIRRLGKRNERERY